MNRIKVDEKFFDHAGKRINEGDTASYERVTYFHANTLRSKDARIFFAPLRDKDKMN